MITLHHYPRRGFALLMALALISITSAMLGGIVARTLSLAVRGMDREQELQLRGEDGR